MVDVKMRTAYAGPNGSGQPGSVVSVPEQLAKIWVDLGFASYFTATTQAKPETAMTAAPENAMEPSGEAR